MKNLCTSVVLFLLFLGSVFVSCKDDNTPGGPLPGEDSVRLVQSAVPDTVSWNGGVFGLTVDTENESWQLKVTSDADPTGVVSQYEEKKVTVEIPQYLGEEVQDVTILLLSKDEWVEVCHAKQQPGSVRIGEAVWAKGNLTLKSQPAALSEQLLPTNWSFVAAAESDPGLYFKHRSTYGILSDGDAYSGPAYDPSPSAIALADIPAGNGDPCAQLAPAGRWRLPSMGELEELASYCEDGVKTVDGMACRVFDGGKLLMPLAGACDTLGSIGFKQTNGGYWGSGEDVEGHGSVMMLGTDDFYVFVHYNLTGSLASVRCVRNEGGAHYVSHTPTEPQTYEGFELTVTCQSELDEFEVMVACEEEQFVEKAGKDRLTVSFDIPANDGTEDRVYKIYVNDDYTGQSVTQTYKAGYALYVSHSPEGPVPGDAFDLTVTCKSDMDEFPVALRGEGVDLTQTGSKSDPEVTFSVPANTGAEARELKIFVGGADCGKSVVQQSKYTDVAVGQTTWARGNVVLEGGQFAIGAPTDYGLYFKFNSTYGMPYDPGAAYYQGTAYNPNPVTIGWKDMAADAGGDPCRLVAPADTWRLPTRSEIEALNGTAGDSLTLNGVLGQSYAGGALFVPTAGILYDNTGAGLAEYRGQGEFGYIWSSTRIYSMCFEEEVCEVYPVGENYALSVRCVKNVNYAFYVSHTPSTVQTSDAFDLTVTCKSDLAEFPVQVRGGDVDMTVDASKTSPTARFSIPANETDADRELKIYVNGIYTGKSVRQAKKESGEPEALQWAEGNIVLKDGQFAVGAPTDLGLLFKFRSVYGVSSDGTEYGGTAYMPSETTVAWGDIPYNEGDPCALVAPTGTWRLPTKAEYVELIKTYEVTTIDGVAGMNLGPDAIFFPAAGYRKAADGSLAAQGRYWTGDEASGEKGSFLGFATTAVAKPNANMNFPQQNAFSVRCVRGGK